MKRYWVAVLLVSWIAAGSVEAAVKKEDLSECKMPNGITLIPDMGSGGGRYIFKFSDAKFHRPPSRFPRNLGNLSKFFRALRRREVGDLIYSVKNGGTFFTVSGKMVRLKKPQYLYERNKVQSLSVTEVWRAEGMKILPPMALRFSLMGVEAGTCFSIQTVDG